MAIISYKNKFIFIKGRKIAGTSMELALLKFCGRNDVVGKMADEHYNEWIGLKSAKKYISSAQSKKINVKGFYSFIASFVKVLPLTKSPASIIVVKYQRSSRSLTLNLTNPFLKSDLIISII